LANFILPDHDADAFKPIEEKQLGNILDSFVYAIFGGFQRWDGVYFIHIAQHGYTFENTLAFFPLFPISVRFIANSLFIPLQFILQYSNVLLVSSWVVNTFFFVRTAEVLLLLGLDTTKNNAIAYKAALLFCVCPASVFMSAPYSESLFAFLTFSGLLHLHRENIVMAALYFSLSFTTRSNGLLNICFLLYFILKYVLHRVIRLYKAAMMNWQVVLAIPWIFISTTMIPYLFVILMSILPLITFQVYCYKLYCSQTKTIIIEDHVMKIGLQNNLKMPGNFTPSWCSDRLPLSYR